MKQVWVNAAAWRPTASATAVAALPTLTTAMPDPSRYPLLAQAGTPVELRALPAEDLPALAAELRAYLIESVGRSGGHFAAGLGVVELSVALHWIYGTPDDRIVWDVGHQAYPHKILTGRADRIHTVKQAGPRALAHRHRQAPSSRSRPGRREGCADEGAGAPFGRLPTRY